MWLNIWTSLLVLGAALFSMGCEEQSQEPPQEMIRAVKTLTVSKVADSRMRRFAGVARAVTRSQLSFPISGRVMDIRVDVGDRIERDAVLARLDQEAYALQVARAQADLEKAQVELRDSRDDFQRRSRLADTGGISRSSLDSAQARFEAAKKSVELARTQLRLARRDLEHTALRAPFAGVVVERAVDPFTEIRPGQLIFELEGENELEIALLIPETLIGWIHPGQEVTVNFPAAPLSGQGLPGKVSRIGRRADAANAYSVMVTLLDPRSGIRSGMTAEVIFTFPAPTEGVVYLVPINALLPPREGPQALSSRYKDASLFVFDEATSTVVRRSVKIGYLSGNEAGIESGVSEGDIVVVAGVHHLYDGQKVKPFEQP